MIEAVAGGAPLPDVLSAIVRLIERQSEGLYCSILLYEPATRTLRHGAAPSLPREFTAALDGESIGPDAGSCGSAAHLGECVIVEDIASHPYWARYRDGALAHGLRACWSTPVFSAQRELLATFAIYYKQSRGPTQEETHWVATATHLVAIAIVRARSEQALRDVDERRAELEVELRQAQKMDAIGQLAGGIAHDFNNLLSVILGYTVLAIDGLPAEGTLRADLEEVAKAARRASELTRQLLAFSRKQALRPRIVDLNQIVSGFEKMMRRVVGDDVTVTIYRAPELGKTLADPGQMEQVLMNLIVNARDAMPSGGSIGIATRNAILDETFAREHRGLEPGRYVALSVTDTGSGMDTATRERIFEPFFTTKAQGKGTGLGLSTVWGIVRQSGGYVEAESEVGRGTTFTLYLPWVSGQADEPRSERLPPSTVRGTETVLLVEDDEQVRGFARDVLYRHGYVVLEAQNGGEAFLIAEQHGSPVHLLLTDVVLPRMSGRDLAARIRRTLPELRVLFVSGYTEDSVVDQGVLESGVPFLSKPIAPDELLRKVRAVLDAH
ncbi:MAG TPA: ATP-binding protein [Polyangiaceae bacterium]|nr:ATP-binding protein [Polyangiaceae bacterium]